MRNKKSITSILTIGLVALAFVLLPGQGWAGKLKDRDGDRYFNNVDCNDRNAAINPGAAEVCDDGVDNDCDGDTDAADSACATCADGDGDTYYAQAGCGTQVDCDDANADINPGATEACNGVNDDCDADIDEGCVTCTDADTDGFYASSGCGTDVDCNDSDADVYPGAPELCDEVDNQCSGDSGYGFTDEVCSACTDGDSDGYYASSGCGTAVDCDDVSGAINPGADEVCDDGADNNCDGQVDDGCPVAGGDSDGDGIPDAVEGSGFTLSSEFDYWNGTAFVTPPDPIPGSIGCSGKCLNPFRADLFVIWRPLASGSLIDLQDCNIFEFASNPITFGGAEFTVWIIQENGAQTTTRRIAQNPADSIQKAAILQESSSTTGNATGLSQPGTIMVDGKGKGLIRTYKIAQNINDNCGDPDDPGDPCIVEGLGSILIEEAQCHHFKKTASHEIWHVLSALNTADLHIANEDFVMSPAVIYTDTEGGTAYIGDEFSASGRNDPSFQ